jgi:hypothetical protein
MRVKWGNVLVLGVVILAIVLGAKGCFHQGSGIGLLPDFSGSPHGDLYTLIAWGLLLAAMVSVVRLISRR